MKRYLIIIIAILFLAGGGYFYVANLERRKAKLTGELQEGQVVLENETSEQQNNSEKSENKQAGKMQDAEIAKKIEQSVPFIVQAPFGNWKDEIFQNGCEEAAMIMAFEWTKGTLTISADDAQNKIKDIVKFENETLGYNADTDIFDMQKIFQQYFNYNNTEVRENIIINDIKNELQKGSLILVPVFGRALENPNYTLPGPITHMLVIVGYDPQAKEFITNDSGTKRGKGYRYSEDVLFNAIWQYPSGKIHPDPPKGFLKKGMIVVKLK